MTAERVRITRLLRPHWPLLAVAFGAMLLEAGADLMEPWPLKVIFDYVLGDRAVPRDDRRQAG